MGRGNWSELVGAIGDKVGGNKSEGVDCGRGGRVEGAAGGADGGGKTLGARLFVIAGTDGTLLESDGTAGAG